MINWNKILTMVIKNKMNGDFESALYQLIHETYKQNLSDADKEVVTVLITLHESIQGKHNLTKLSQICMDFANGLS